MSSWSTGWICVVIFSAFIRCQATLTRVTLVCKRISAVCPRHP